MGRPGFRRETEKPGNAVWGKPHAAPEATSLISWNPDSFYHFFNTLGTHQELHDADSRFRFEVCLTKFSKDAAKMSRSISADLDDL